jgi:hypothetical protein
VHPSWLGHRHLVPPTPTGGGPGWRCPKGVCPPSYDTVDSCWRGGQIRRWQLDFDECSRLQLKLRHGWFCGRDGHIRKRQIGFGGCRHLQLRTPPIIRRWLHWCIRYASIAYSSIQTIIIPHFPIQRCFQEFRWPRFQVQLVTSWHLPGFLSQSEVYSLNSSKVISSFLKSCNDQLREF